MKKRTTVLFPAKRTTRNSLPYVQAMLNLSYKHRQSANVNFLFAMFRGHLRLSIQYSVNGKCELLAETWKTELCDTLTLQYFLFFNFSRDFTFWIWILNLIALTMVNGGKTAHELRRRSCLLCFQFTEICRITVPELSWIKASLSYLSVVVVDLTFTILRLTNDRSCRTVMAVSATGTPQKRIFDVS